MGSVHRDANAAAHDNAVDEGHVRLRVILDPSIEGIFLTKITKRLVVASAASEIVERAQISTYGESARVVRENDNSGYARFSLPFCELPRQLANHRERYCIERVWPIERHEPRRPPSFEQEIVRPNVFAHK